MNNEVRGLLLLSFSLLLIVPFSSAIDVLFNQSETQYVNVSMPYSSIQDFYFNIAGGYYNGSYPVNITLDVADDNIIDWEYKICDSFEPASANSIFYAWSNNPGSNAIYFVSIIPETDISELDGLGYLENNIFQRAVDSSGNLGLSSAYSLSSQIISITTNDSTIHAFVPAISSEYGTSGLYIAKGGSTYYCNSDHTFNSTISCDLSVEQAINASNLTHLARQADTFAFNFAEPVKNPKIVSSINSRLAGCSIPCNITFKISSATAGNVTLSDFTTIRRGPPANISISENATDYSTIISSYLNLTNVSYFYGIKPNVYILPLVAYDESRNLSENQSKRLLMLNNSLVKAWDNLTNYSHPLNFIFYLNTSSFYKLQNYSVNDNISQYDYAFWHSLIPNLPLVEPAILVVLDVFDYFPENNPSNGKRSGDYDYGLISTICINGFSETNRTFLEGYDDEILRNIVLHELAHSFISYPPADFQKLFYADHPASFSNLTEFDTYDVGESPAGKQGYYEVYSVMNQLRIYIQNSQIGNTLLGLSPLDKMLLGILSPDIEENYTFYSGNITKSGNHYQATAMTSLSSTNTSILYPLSDDSSWWDVRKVSSYIDEGTNSSFSIPKLNQSERALWVFAKDEAHQNHFRVFNNNAQSNQTIISDFIPPKITFLFPNETIYSTDYIDVRINSDKILSSCNLSYDSGGFDTQMTVNESKTGANYSGFYVPDGLRYLRTRCIDILGNINRTAYIPITVDTIYPTAYLYYPTEDDGSFKNQSFVTLHVEVEENNFKNITWKICNATFCNTTTLVNLTDIDFTNLAPSLYLYNSTVCDIASHCQLTDTRSIILYDDFAIIMDLAEWNMNRTTKFYTYTRAQLQNLNNITFSNSYGEIKLLQNINLSQTRDIRQKIKIVNQKAWINSSLIPEFNKPAFITFNNIGLAHPIVKQDNQDCTGCSNISFNNSTGVFSFNVASFSLYELAEQCSDGIQNYDEGGIDCGGSCSTCTSTGNSGSSSGSSSGGGSGSKTDSITGDIVNNLSAVLTNKEDTPIILNNNTITNNTGDDVKSKENTQIPPFIVFFVLFSFLVALVAIVVLIKAYKIVKKDKVYSDIPKPEIS